MCQLISQAIWECLSSLIRLILTNPLMDLCNSNTEIQAVTAQGDRSTNDDI